LRRLFAFFEERRGDFSPSNPHDGEAKGPLRLAVVQLRKP